MYRPQNQSRFYESSYHEENPFFRQTITIIDECTKLMKEDRIFLRNKIKDYLKQLKENRQKEDDWENEQMQMLLQIFVEGNKKKSLSKIQKGDKVMDWLQIKLRKFIDNNKKERHKKEVESFRKIKGLNPKKQIQSNINFERSLQKSRQFSGYNGQKFNDQLNKLQFNLEPRKKTTLPKYSLSKSNEKSPNQSRRKVSQKQPFSNVSFYKQFDYLKKTGSKEKQQPIRQSSSSLLKNRYLYHESRPISSQLSKFNKSLEHNKPSERSKDKTINQNISKLDEQFLKSKQIKQNTKQNQLSKQQIDKLALLFSNQLNYQQQKERITFKPVQPHFLHPDYNMKRDITIPSTKLPSQPSFDRGALILDNPTRYDASNKKIQQMLRSSQEILASYEKQQQGMTKFQPIDPLPIPREITVPKVSSNEDLFTPPDFLAECRKYMFSSNKKKTEDDVLPSQSDERFIQPYKQTTFSDILNESKQKTLQKIYRGNPLSINDSLSENVSANLSTNKPESEVHFQYRNVSITSVESLLLQIFKLSHRRTLDRYQVGQIMSKCNKETQQAFQQCCDALNQQSDYINKLSFNFLSIVKFFYNQKKILQPNKEYFSIFLSKILDIRKKGYIEEDDIRSFIESLESSQLDASVLQSIETYLQSVFKRGCEVEEGNVTTYWSLYYLELKSDLNFLNLKQHLNKFQFELEQSIDQ